MTIKQKFEQKQLQKLIMTPALQDAIKLLPLNNLELIQVINQNLIQNPLLEIEGETQGKEEETSSEENVKERDSEIMDLFKEYFNEDYSFQDFYEAKELPPLENIASQSPSLWDHLNWQANLTFFDKKEREIAKNIIGNINQDGYLEISVEELAKACHTSKKKVERVRKIIKNFDPVGVGSLNLKECLLTQLKHYGIKNNIVKKIINNYLHLLEKINYEQLAKDLGLSLSELKNHLDIIKRLNPKPGAKFEKESLDYITPDVFIEKDEKGYKVFINNEGIPKLRINPFYKKLLLNSEKINPSLSKYLEEKLKSALWFLRSLNHRNLTLYKVVKYVIEKQKDFLEKGIDWIKPLTLAEVAEAVDVHESTVSRIVSNKYILTPQGLLPLKFFFQKGITDLKGEEISSEIIKEKIQSLIEKEDPNNPLTDTDIVRILEKHGIKLARRTVTKYRQQLKIPPSYIRKRNTLMEEVK